MTRIAIIGGHGKIALLAAAKLVHAGHQVTSLFRNPQHAAEVAQTGATPRVADVENMSVKQIAEVLRGHDVLIWSAGAGGGEPERTYSVDRDAAIRSMDAAQSAQISRYLMVSYFGAGLDHGVPPQSAFYAYAEAKAAADAYLRDTDLAWTILMPSALTSQPSRGTLELGSDAVGDTSRELVADVMVAVLASDSETLSHADLPFTDGDVPIAQALAGLREQ